MKKIPNAMIIVDPKKEEIAIKEARKLNIPVFGIVDTNCDPDDVDFVIPGNDDAVRAVKLIIGVLTNAIAEVNGNEVIDYISEEDKAKNAKKAEKVEKSENKVEEKEEVAEVKGTPKKEEEAVEEKEVKKEEKPVEKKTAKKETKKEEVKEDLSTKTLAELKAIAKEKGVKGYSTMKKADLVAALEK